MVKVGGWLRSRAYQHPDRQSGEKSTRQHHLPVGSRGLQDPSEKKDDSSDEDCPHMRMRGNDGGRRQLWAFIRV